MVYLSASLKGVMSVRPSEAIRVLPEVFCGFLELVSFLLEPVSYAFLEGSGVGRCPSLAEGGLFSSPAAILEEVVVHRPSLVEGGLSSS